MRSTIKMPGNEHLSRLRTVELVDERKQTTPDNDHLTGWPRYALAMP